MTVDPDLGSLDAAGPRWHLIEKPRAPFVCDVCGATIPESEAGTFTTLAKMYYEPPPAGYVPCNRGFDPLAAKFGLH